MTPFRLHQEVAAVEHDPETVQPRKRGKVIYGTITDVTGDDYLGAIRVRFSDGGRHAFLIHHGEIIQTSHHWRLFPVCARPTCDRPALNPVKDPDDPTGRSWCSDECATDDAERAAGAMADIEYSDGYERTVR